MSRQEIPNNEPLDITYDEDYLHEQHVSESVLTEDYWDDSRQTTIDTINSIYETRFCYADVIAAVMEVTEDDKISKKIGDKLNELYIRRTTFDVQVNGE